MSSNSTVLQIDLAAGVIRKWKETYRWIPIFGAVAAISMAFSVGANNLPAPFSTPVGSGALTLLQASIMACVIYVPGAAFASNSTVNALFSDFIAEKQPNEGFLMWSLVVVLVTATLWLVLATCFELPVSSQQSTQGALLGTMLVTEGFSFIPLWNKNENHNFNGGGLLWIFLEWTVAPLIACALSFCLFSVLKTCLLPQENAEKRVHIFIPIYYGIAAGLLCLFVVYEVLPNFVTVYKWANIVAILVATLIGALLSLVVVVPFARKRFDTTFKTIKKRNSLKQQGIESQDHQTCDAKEGEGEFEVAFKDFMQMRVLDTVYEEDERSWASPEKIAECEQAQSNTGQSTHFKQLLESTPNHLVQSRSFRKIEKTSAKENALSFIRGFTKFTLFPVIEHDRHTLIRHALAEKFDEIEDFLLIQSANEVAAIMSPFAAIEDVYAYRAKYSGNGKDLGDLEVSWWFRAVGGLSASAGFFLCGWRLTQCLGGKLTYISNSRGMMSQLTTVATIIFVTRMKLPVSSVHAFVGSLVGVGIADDYRNVNWKLLVKFLCGWVITILFCCTVAYGMYSFTLYSPAYVVP
ncbi:Phosphate permease [Actinidia chinensis var. chinensis]|uniref:Phosphate transporter n=1 Tax=Actinidia chinensis var. chinensis TaxID=1590841 RepID=A0A2R6RG79_ACTCC|nr:Phosphate permease [Actinidia chinensis var. chinensis]